MHQTPVISDETKIRQATQKILADNPKAVSDLKSGKQQALFFLIGQVKKEVGDIDVIITKEIISELINNA